MNVNTYALPRIVPDLVRGGRLRLCYGYSRTFLERSSDYCRPSIPPRPSRPTARLCNRHYPDAPLLLPTLRNTSLQQYIRSLLSLSQQASEPSPNVPVRVLHRRAHIM